MQSILGILFSLALVALTRCGPVVAVNAQQPATWPQSWVESMEATDEPVQDSAARSRFSAE